MTFLHHAVPDSMDHYAQIIQETDATVCVLKFLYFEQKTREKRRYLLIARQSACPSLGHISRLLGERVSLITLARKTIHPLMDDIRVDQMLIDESMLSDQNLNSVAFLWDDQRDCSQVMSWNDFIEQIQTSATWKSLDLQREILVPVRSVPSPRARTRHLPKWIQTSCFNDAQEGGNFEFQGLKFSCDFSTLAAQNQRIMCPKCRETRKFYCYDCLIPLSETIPRVSLPVNLCIVQHASEKLAKSTSVHAKLLAPNHVHLVSENEFDDARFNVKNSIVLLPSDQSVPVTDISVDQLKQIENVILLDGPWQKVHGMVLRNPALQQFQHVSLSQENISTHFWRYNSRTSQHLSTIEAIYYFINQFSSQLGMDTCYDDLLYYFAFLHKTIKENMRDTFIEVMNTIN